MQPPAGEGLSSLKYRTTVPQIDRFVSVVTRTRSFLAPLACGFPECRCGTCPAGGMTMSNQRDRAVPWAGSLVRRLRPSVCSSSQSAWSGGYVDNVCPRLFVPFLELAKADCRSRIGQSENRDRPRVVLRLGVIPRIHRFNLRQRGVRFIDDHQRSRRERSRRSVSGRLARFSLRPERARL